MRRLILSFVALAAFLLLLTLSASRFLRADLGAGGDHVSFVRALMQLQPEECPALSHKIQFWTDVLVARETSDLRFDIDGSGTVTVADAILMFTALLAIEQDSCGPCVSGLIKVGEEFSVDTRLERNMGVPLVTADRNGNFVVVWDVYEGRWKIYARRYSFDGSPLGELFRASTGSGWDDWEDEGHISVRADDNGDFTIIWSSVREVDTGMYERSIYIRRFSADGTPLGEEFKLNPMPNNAYSITATTDENGNAVSVWTVTNGLNSEGAIFVRRYNSAGLAMGDAFQVNEGRQDGADPIVMADANGNFIVVWVRKVPFPGSSDIFARRFRSDGSPAGAEFRVNTTDRQYYTDVRAAADGSGRFTVIWPKEGRILARRFNADGSPASDEFQVAASADGSSLIYPWIAANRNGDMIVTWSSGSPGGLYAQGYAPDGSPLGSVLKINSTDPVRTIPGFSSIGFGENGKVMIAWKEMDSNDIRARRLRFWQCSGTAEPNGGPTIAP